jgi:hypothetical protein
LLKKPFLELYRSAPIVKGISLALALAEVKHFTGKKDKGRFHGGKL